MSRAGNPYGAVADIQRQPSPPLRQRVTGWLFGMRQARAPARPRVGRQKTARLLLLCYGAPLFFNAFWNYHLAYVGTVPYFLADGLVHLVVPLAMLAFAIHTGLTPVRLGLHDRIGGRRSANNTALVSVAIGMLFVPFWFFVDLIPAPIDPKADPFFLDPFYPVPEGFGAWYAVTLYMSVTAGFFEEVVFRGMGRLCFADTVAGKCRYVLITSVIFSAMHWEQGVAGLQNTLLFGLVTAILYLKLRNLWPLIAGHFAVDWVVFTWRPLFQI